MARVEIKGLGFTPVIGRRLAVQEGVAFGCSGAVYAAATDPTTLTGAQLVSNIDGEWPGWLEPGVYTITIPETGKTVTFEVGGFAGTSAVAEHMAQTTEAHNLTALLAAKSAKLHASDHQPGGPDALGVDAAANTGSLRSLGQGALQAAPGAAEQKTLVNAAGGATPAFSTNWSNVPTWEPLGFFRWGPLVVVSGLIKKTVAGSPGEVIFTLPAGYRPSVQKVFVGASGSAEGRFDVQSGGQVVWQLGDPTTLFGIDALFRAA